MKRSVSDFNTKGIKCIFQEDEEVGMSAKELEEAKKADKELQSRNVSVKYMILYLTRCVSG